MYNNNNNNLYLYSVIYSKKPIALNNITNASYINLHIERLKLYDASYINLHIERRLEHSRGRCMMHHTILENDSLG